jgi:hypothetical protein
MLRSAAWRSLGGNAVRILLELHTRFHGANNGHVFLSLDEASELLSMGKSTALAAFEDLRAKGFLREKRKGGFVRGKATTYELTFKPSGAPTGYPPKQREPRTDDWRHWTPTPKAEKRRKPWGSTKRSMPPPPKTFPGPETERISENTVLNPNVCQDENPIGSESKPYGGVSEKNTVLNPNAYITTPYFAVEPLAKRALEGAVASERLSHSDDKGLEPLATSISHLKLKIAGSRA